MFCSESFLPCPFLQPAPVACLGMDDTTSGQSSVLGLDRNYNSHRVTTRHRLHAKSVLGTAPSSQEHGGHVSLQRQTQAQSPTVAAAGFPPQSLDTLRSLLAHRVFRPDDQMATAEFQRKHAKASDGWTGKPNVMRPQTDNTTKMYTNPSRKENP